MTIRGFLREIDAGQRRAARNEERRQRLEARAAKLQAKINELEWAAAEAEAYSERIQQLTTIHHDVGEEMDWTELSNRPPPPEPLKGDRWEAEARQVRDTFKPTFW